MRELRAYDRYMGGFDWKSIVKDWRAERSGPDCSGPASQSGRVMTCFRNTVSTGPFRGSIRGEGHRRQ